MNSGSLTFLNSLDDRELSRRLRRLERALASSVTYPPGTRAFWSRCVERIRIIQSERSASA